MPEPIEVLPYNPQWPQWFEQEQARLLGALGWCTQGGVVYRLEHIGSTAVVGLAAKPCIDILLDVHPFPLSETHIAALQQLGYVYKGENGLEGRQYFQLGPHRFHLHVVSGQGDFWPDHVLFRDYLRQHPPALERYAQLKLDLAQRYRHQREAYTDGKSELIGQLKQQAYAWHLAHTGFNPVQQAAQELAGVQGWFVSSGWALDCFLRKPSRYHHDLDLALWRNQAPQLQAHLLQQGWQIYFIQQGQYHAWMPGAALPSQVHQLHARRGNELLDVLLSPRQEDQWLYRRNPSIALPIQQAVLHFEGIPFLAPQAVLLFKSSHANQDPRSKDQQDFERVLPHLSTQAKQWLTQALQQSHPQHEWIERLG